MNAHAVAVEKGQGRPIMSSFHAAFSLGGLAGAAVGGAVAAWGVGVAPHLAGVSALSLAAFALAYLRMLPADEDRGESGEPAFARPTRALAGLGVISFCVLLGEGAMADWSAVYLKGTLGTGPGFAAAGSPPSRPPWSPDVSSGTGSLPASDRWRSCGPGQPSRPWGSVYPSRSRTRLRPW